MRRWRRTLCWLGVAAGGLLSLAQQIATAATFAGDALFTARQELSVPDFRVSNVAIFSGSPFVAGVPSPTITFDFATGSLRSTTDSFDGIVDLNTGRFSGFQRSFGFSLGGTYLKVMFDIPLAGVVVQAGEVVGVPLDLADNRLDAVLHFDDLWLDFQAAVFRDADSSYAGFTTPVVFARTDHSLALTLARSTASEPNTIVLLAVGVMSLVTTRCCRRRN